jgi:hypothetical protein
MHLLLVGTLNTSINLLASRNIHQRLHSMLVGQLDKVHITPPFPEYPSGHSVCSGSADRALTNYLGTVAFTDSVNFVSFGYTPRTFTSFTAAADEAGMSRIYGGIHFMEAIQSGLVEGRNIGQHVTDKIKFK